MPHASSRCRDSTSPSRLEAREVVPGQEPVDVRKRRAHPARERLVLGMALQRVHPDDRVGLPRQARHLAPEQSARVLALPAVGDDHDDGAARSARGGPTRRCTPSATRRSASRRTSRRRASPPARARAPGRAPRAPASAASSRVPNANASTPAPEPTHARARTEQERARVRLHRAGDVAEHDQLARHVVARGGTRARPGRRRCASDAADEPAQVELAAARCAAAAAGSGAADARRRSPRSASRRASNSSRRQRGEVLRRAAAPRSSSRAAVGARRRLALVGAAGRRRRDAARRSAASAARSQAARPARAGTRPRKARSKTLEVLARARRASGAQRPVDVVLPRQVDAGRGRCSASAMRPGPTSSPASRRTRPNVTTCRTTRASRRQRRASSTQIGERGVADGLAGPRGT